MDNLLFTGATGFLGRNILPLISGQYKVTTLGRSKGNMLQVDIANPMISLPHHFDIVLHAAGKAHVVPKSEDDVQQFYEINYGGTVHLCDSLERVGVPKSFIFISSVSVYGSDSEDFVSELHALNGTSPYAKSKIQAESYLTQWCRQHNVILSILRPSLIMGNDNEFPGNLGSMVEGIRRGYYANIGGRQVRKSMVMADDVAKILPLVAGIGGVYNICDSTPPTIVQLSAVIARQMGKKKPITIPYWMVWGMAKIGDLFGDKAIINTYRLARMTKSETFSNEKARRELGWTPLDVLKYFKVRWE